MTNKGNIAIRQHMRSILSEHTDLATGEINMTTLAEDAIQEFDLSTEHDIERAFECAFDVSKSKSTGFPGSMARIFVSYDSWLR